MRVARCIFAMDELLMSLFERPARIRAAGERSCGRVRLEADSTIASYRWHPRVKASKLTLKLMISATELPEIQHSRIVLRWH